MKKSNRLILLLLMVPLFSQVNAQKYFNIHRPIVLPDKSPEALVKQTIGYTDISIQYHSPGARGRQIWGGIVPFGQVWRAGANENTVFSITHDAEIEGQILPAGTYGLHLLPEKEEWTFIFFKKSYFLGQLFL
jgi:hypothetical protein